MVMLQSILTTASYKLNPKFVHFWDCLMIGQYYQETYAIFLNVLWVICYRGTNRPYVITHFFGNSLEHILPCFRKSICYPLLKELFFNVWNIVFYIFNVEKYPFRCWFPTFLLYGPWGVFWGFPIKYGYA